MFFLFFFFFLQGIVGVCGTAATAAAAAWSGSISGPEESASALRPHGGYPFLLPEAHADGAHRGGMSSKHEVKREEQRI